MFSPFSFYGGLPDPNIIFLNDNIITSQAVLESKLTGETIKYFIIDGNEKTSFSKTNYTINNNAFKGVSNANKNPITYVKMEKATIIYDNAFQYCSLNELDFPNTTAVAAGAFRDNTGNIQTGYFPLATSLGNTAFGINSLHPNIQIRQDISGSGILYIPSWLGTNTGNAALFNNNNLTGSISNVDSNATHYLPNIDRMGGDYSWSSNKFTKLDLIGITTIGGFNNNVGFSVVSQTDPLASVYIPNATTIKNYAFQSCNITKADLPFVSSFAGFASNNALTSVSQTDSNASIYIPSVVSVGGAAFQLTNVVGIDLPNLTSITGTSNFRANKATSVSTTSSFLADIQLNNLPANGFDGSDSSFNGSYFTKFYMPRILNTPNATFAGLTNAAITTISQTDPSASIYIPDVVNTANISYQGAFSACNKLVSADLPYMTQIGTYMFNGATPLNYVNLPGITKGYLGTSPTTNNSFGNTALNGTINVPLALATNNAGGPDADLVYLAGRGWTINYI